MEKIVCVEEIKMKTTEAAINVKSMGDTGSIEEMRKIAANYMYEMSKVEWTPEKTFSLVIEKNIILILKKGKHTMVYRIQVNA